MVDMTMIAEAVTSLKTASEIAKTLIGLKEAGAIQTKVAELNGIILSAQSSALAAQSNQFTLLQRVGNLEKEIASLKELLALKNGIQRSNAMSLQRLLIVYSLTDLSWRWTKANQCIKYVLPAINMESRPFFSVGTRG